MEHRTSSEVLPTIGTECIHAITEPVRRRRLSRSHLSVATSVLSALVCAVPLFLIGRSDATWIPMTSCALTVMLMSIRSGLVVTGLIFTMLMVYSRLLVKDDLTVHDGMILSGISALCCSTIVWVLGNGPLRWVRDVGSIFAVGLGAGTALTLRGEVSLCGLSLFFSGLSALIMPSLGRPISVLAGDGHRKLVNRIKPVHWRSPASVIMFTVSLLLISVLVAMTVGKITGAL